LSTAASCDGNDAGELGAGSVRFISGIRL
jgi:hypothetical protein